MIDDLAQIAAACRYDPLKWAELAYPWGRPGSVFADEDIRVWQSEVLDDLSQHLLDPKTRFMPYRQAIASGHGIGKSAGMGILSNWAMSCHDRPRVVITANTENQLRTKTSPEVGQWFRNSISAPLFNIDTMRISLANSPEASQWAVDFVPWSEHNTEAFAGLHAKKRLVMLLMDEASAIANKVWEVAEGALTDEDTILIWIAFGNPTQAVGSFRECFRRQRNRWRTANIDSREVEGTNKQVLQEIVDTYGENSDIAKVRVRGQFPSMSSRQLIGEHLVLPAMKRHLRKQQYDFAPVILSCDPAWTGEDNLVIAKRQGLRFDILDVMPKNDNDLFIAQKLANYEVNYDASEVFVDLGWGTGIKSAGDAMGRSWRLVNFSDKSTNPGCLNKRSEMYVTGLEWLEAGGAISDDQDLFEDMIGIQTKPRPDGKIQLMSKEDMKREGLPSPDRSDAWALTFAYPVENPALSARLRTARQSGRARVQQTEYDPFAEAN